MTIKERESHELPYTEIVKSGTIRLASGNVQTADNIKNVPK